jgi:RNA polymerase sigma factor (sigma-70 family)
LDNDHTIHLIKRCLKGDPLAQHQLFHQYVKAMYNTVLRLVDSEFEAQDVVQEGFIRAFQKMDQFRFRSSFGAWLKRIMINCALDRLRKNIPEFTDLERVIEEASENETESLSLPSPEVINREILNLPRGCRQVFSLYLLEGYDQKQVADELGISVSTVKTQYRRAKQLLKERLMTR